MDAGRAWKVVRPTRRDLHALALRKGAGVACGEAGALVRLFNGGRSWSVRSSGGARPLRGVVLTPGGGWAVGGDPVDGPVVLHTEDGVAWRAQSPGEGSGLNAVDSMDGTCGIAVGNDGDASFTDDMGYTWMEGSSHTTVPLNDVQSLSTLEAWAVGGSFTDSTVAIHTTDGGLTWRRVTTGTGAGLTGVDFVDPSAGWAVGWNGVVRHTADGGASWSPQVSGVTRQPTAVDFVDALRGWAVGARGTILHTVDGGFTWMAQTSGTTVTLRDVRFSSATDGPIAGENGVPLATADGGQTWTPEAPGTANDLTGLWVGGEGEALVVGNGGTVLGRLGE